ncbi:MAG: 3-phosphoshikimate 1-carboxyvinyltransferase [Gammaproteobacteria bacterium]
MRVPGDKSISHRAVMLSSIADGTTEITDCLMSEDVRSTIAAFRAMGVTIDEQVPGRLSIDGRGFGALAAPAGHLDLGNSGTSIRLLAGLLAGAGIPVTMTGDRSLLARPMRRVTDPLVQMGARITTGENGTPPLTIMPESSLRAIRYELPIGSAQVKSAILLAGLHTDGQTCVVEPAPTRDHTERMLSAFGVNLEIASGEIKIDGGQKLTATSIIVPGDISSAAFFLVGAAIVEGSEVILKNVGVNPTRTGVIEILRQMGVIITLSNERSTGLEPVADITVRGARLTGIDISPDLVPSAIDEFPAIFVAAACASGITRLVGASELRHKESDRIDAMADGLQSLGTTVSTSADGIEIVGRVAGFDGGRVASVGDHRVAMAFAMAGLRAAGPIEITDCAAIGTSFPGFVESARQLGLKAFHD